MEVDRDFLGRLLVDDLEAMGFGEDDGEEVIEALSEAVVEYLPQLRSAVEASGVQEVGFFAHALKGTFNNFSTAQFVCLAELFKNMEGEAKSSGNLEKINNLMGRIDSEMEVFFT